MNRHQSDQSGRLRPDNPGQRRSSFTAIAGFTGFLWLIAISRVLALDVNPVLIDVSNPADPQRVGGYDTSGGSGDVAVVAGRIYVADGYAGLLVLPSLPNVQFTMRVEATPNAPFTLEAATDFVGYEHGK